MQISRFSACSRRCRYDERMIDTTHYVTGAPVTWEALPTGASLATNAPALHFHRLALDPGG
ncbi:hypothetical protein [Stenotrophomonas maltophilia]|uniref:hypothetical protein n=1 Tax=Stenotrophomonas maltophilia TaxID=40324 RepID=UPI003D7D5236